MVWNGRNESLGLGLKAATAASAGDVDVSKANDTASPSSSTASIKSSSTAGKTSTSNAASTPQPSTTASSGKSVWNGTHHKIMEISEKSSSNKDASSNDSIKQVVESVEKTTISSTDSNGTKEQRVVVSPPTTVDTTPVVTKDQGREDDITTNSTAGSSTTNTIDEDPAMPDSVTMTSLESEEKKSEDQPSTEVTNDEGTTATSAPPARNVTANNANTANNNKQKNSNNSNKNKKAQGNNQQHPQQQPRRTGNNKNRSNSVGNNKQHNKGNNGAAGRRKANKEKEVVCAFFLKNMCNRGAACNFRHDNAAVGGTVKTTKQHHNKKYHKQPNAAASTAAPPSKPPTTTSAYPFASKRVFDPYKARAITLAKGAQDQEDRSSICTAFRISEDGLVKEEIADPPFFSIDVECIATGYGSCARGINDGCGNEGKNGDVPEGMYNERSHRYPGRVAMVDTDGNVLADIVIRPPQDGKGIVSYLTALTGLTEEFCLGADAKSLEEAVQIIKGLLPKDGVLVGQAIDHDVEWLGLTPGKDFARMVDISEIFRQRMPFNLNDASEVMKKIESGEIASPSSSGDVSSDEYLGFATRYRHFSLRHVCLNLLNEDIQSGVHNPISDASYSLKLFHKYRNAGVTQLRIVRDGLHRAPPTPSFSQEYTPVIDGVCVSAAGYKHKRAARKIWSWYAGKKATKC
ncbi:hypothetical protein ACHAWT_004855 [Skeletonema menzelii]